VAGTTFVEGVEELLLAAAPRATFLALLLALSLLRVKRESQSHMW
jgi:hypothetical protein